MIREEGPYPWGMTGAARRRKHKLRISYVGKYAIHFSCRRCPMTVLVDKFQMREVVKGNGATINHEIGFCSL